MTKLLSTLSLILAAMACAMLGMLSTNGIQLIVSVVSMALLIALAAIDARD